MLNSNSNGTNSKAKEVPANSVFFSQAFVTPHPYDKDQIIVHQIPGSGIPMRDYFAAKIAAAFCDEDSGYDSQVQNFAAIARDAYRLADAMLKARAQSKPEEKGFPYTDGQL